MVQVVKSDHGKSFYYQCRLLSCLRKSDENFTKSLQDLNCSEGLRLYYDPLLYMFSEMLNGIKYEDVVKNLQSKNKIITENAKDLKNFWPNTKILDCLKHELPTKEIIITSIDEYEKLFTTPKIAEEIPKILANQEILKKIWKFCLRLYLKQVETFAKTIDFNDAVKNIEDSLGISKDSDNPHYQSKMSSIFKAELEYLMQQQASHKSPFYYKNEKDQYRLVQLCDAYKIDKKLYPKKLRNIKSIPGENDTAASDDFYANILKRSVSLIFESIHCVHFLLELQQQHPDSAVNIYLYYPGIPEFNKLSKTFSLSRTCENKDQCVVGTISVLASDMSSVQNSIENRNQSTIFPNNNKPVKYRNNTNIIISISLFIISLLLLSLSAFYYNARGIQTFFKGNPIKICLNILLILLPIVSFSGMVFAFRQSKLLQKNLHKIKYIPSENAIDFIKLKVP